MSYDFTIFKPRRAITSMSEIQPENLFLQSGEATRAELTELFPAIEWEDKGERGWLGKLLADSNPYEFRLPAGEDQCWNINTPEENSQTDLVETICTSLQLLAFDGQTLELIDANGRRYPAA